MPSDENKYIIVVRDREHFANYAVKGTNIITMMEKDNCSDI